VADRFLGHKAVQMNRRKNRRERVYDGSSFNSFLNEEGIRGEVEAIAIKRLWDW
jgi:hypothetical protein